MTAASGTLERCAEGSSGAVIGLISDFLFKAVNRRLFAWRFA